MPRRFGALLEPSGWGMPRGFGVFLGTRGWDMPWALGILLEPGAGVVTGSNSSPPPMLHKYCVADRSPQCSA